MNNECIWRWKGLKLPGWEGRKTWVTALAVLLAGVWPAEAADVRAADFDEGARGMSREERLKYHMARLEPKLKDLDSNGDILVTQDEVDAWLEKVEERELESRGVQHPAAATLDPELVEDAFPPVIKTEAWGLLGGDLRLRKKTDDLWIKNSDAKAFKAVDPAEFHFVRDHLSGEDVWSAEAALGLYHEIADGKGNAPILGVLPSLYWHRTTGAGTTQSFKEADTLAYKLGLEAVTKGALGFNAHVVSLTGAYTTNTDHDLDKNWNVAVDWRPVLLGNRFALNGAWPQVPGIAGLRYHPELRLHGRAGEDFEKDESYAFAGPEMKITFRLDDDLGELAGRVLPFVGYRYFWELDGSHGDLEKFTAGVAWQLDAMGQATLSLAYEWGENEDDFTEVDEVRLSLGVKF